MRRECRERFPHHRIQRKPRVSDPSMHHGTCVTHVPWRMPGSLTRGGGENVPGIPSACATRIFTYLARGPLPEPMVAQLTNTHTTDMALCRHDFIQKIWWQFIQDYSCAIWLKFPVFPKKTVFTKSRQHVCHVRRKIQMSDVGFVKIIIIWCLRLPIGRRRVKSIREDWKNKQTFPVNSF